MRNSASIVGPIIFSAFLAGCYSHAPVCLEKINGASLVAGREITPGASLRHLDSIGAGWVAIIPFAFASRNAPELYYNHPGQWQGETLQGVAKQIEYAHAQGFKVMVKPHVWVKGDGWPGQFTLDTEEKWNAWEKNYTAYITAYLRVADSLKAELFCIGTEFNQAIIQRPGFWEKLAATCRHSYSGKLTYAANWDNYMEVKCWHMLDFIGIDAYFPVSDEKNPTLRRIKKGWEEPKRSLLSLAARHQRPILFTEFGYRSADFAAAKHWEIDEEEEGIVNIQAQVTAYEALFQTFWEEPLFAGGFLWKWFPEHSRAGGVGNNDYTPQNKPTEKTIRRWYIRSNCP